MPESVWDAIDDIRAAVDNLVTADEIAAEVAKRVRQERGFALSTAQKLGALAVGLGALATAIHSWIG